MHTHTQTDTHTHILKQARTHSPGSLTRCALQDAAVRVPVHRGLCGSDRGGEKLPHHHADPVQGRPEGGAAVQQPHAAPVAQGQEPRRDVSCFTIFQVFMVVIPEAV